MIDMPHDNIYKLELTHGGKELSPPPGVDVVLHTCPGLTVESPGQIRTYTTDNRAEGMTPVVTSPFDLEETIHATLRPGVRAIIGNAGAELTFRHVFGSIRDNVRQLLNWANEAYELVGDRLILGPMDYDLLQDAMYGCRLMRWAAKRNVPLAVFCGYRFLFPPDAFEHIRWACWRFPMDVPWSHYRYPYRHLSRQVRQTGVELWVGAGTYEGLAAGTLERARDFGIRGVFTDRGSWLRYFQDREMEAATTVAQEHSVVHPPDVGRLKIGRANLAS